jgi:hypothetical protein
MSGTTSEVVRRAIAAAKQIYTYMDLVSSSTTLKKIDANNALMSLRDGNEPMLFLLQYAADADRNAATIFTQEIGSAYTTQDIQTEFTNVSVLGQVFVDAYFDLFAPSNIPISDEEIVTLQDGTRIEQLKSFGSPDIDALKAAALALKNALPNFA